MNRAIRHDPAGETLEAKLAWFARLSLEERLAHANETMCFLLSAGVVTARRREEEDDATRTARVVRLPGSE